jgi:hypothetical protein
MPFRRTSIVRDFATALAVMAVYVLVLLAPLHQAAGLQKDLASLGYDSIANWSICATAAPTDSKDKSAADIKCPAAGIGKYELAAIDPVVIDLAIDRLAGAVAYSDAIAEPLSHMSPHIGEARAPPAAA